MALLAVAAVAAAAKAAIAAVPMVRVAAAEALALHTPTCTHAAKTTQTQRVGNPDEINRTLFFRRAEDLVSTIIVDRPQQGRVFTREHAVHAVHDDTATDVKGRRGRGSLSPAKGIAP